MSFSGKKAVLTVFSTPLAPRTLEMPAVLSPACLPVVSPRNVRKLLWGFHTRLENRLLSGSPTFQLVKVTARVSFQRHPSCTQTDTQPLSHRSSSRPTSLCWIEVPLGRALASQG